jgi:capsule polysaccharide export protein KpsE/RkpR
VTKPARAPITSELREENDFLSELSPEDVRISRERTVARLRLFWNRRAWLFRVFLASLVFSTLVAFLIPSRYEAVTKIMPPDNQAGAGMAMLSSLMGGRGDSGGRAAAIGGIAGDLLGLKSTGAVFQGILMSRTVQDRLIEEFELEKLYRDSKIEDARKDLARHTEVSEDRKSGIISVTVWDHDPNRSTAMATAYVQELNRLVAEVSTSSARRERIFLEGRLQTVKLDLQSAAKSFSDFASRNTAIDIPAQGKAMVEAAAMLQGELIAAQAELSGLQQIYADTNVRVRAAQARVAALQRKLNQVGGEGTPGQLENDNSLYPSIRKLPLLGVTWADLYRQTKIQETVYELLTEQYELAKVQEAKEIPTVKVLDAATVPTKKSFPPRGLVAAFGALLGVALGMAWLSGKAYWDSVQPNDPRKEFATEVLTTVQGYVPKFSHNGSAVETNGNGSWTFWKKPESSNVENRESDKLDRE